MKIHILLFYYINFWIHELIIYNCHFIILQPQMYITIESKVCFLKKNESVITVPFKNQLFTLTVFFSLSFHPFDRNRHFIVLKHPSCSFFTSMTHKPIISRINYIWTIKDASALKTVAVLFSKLEFTIFI